MDSKNKYNKDIPRTQRNYKELVISGGGTNGMGILGTLDYLYKNNYLKNIKRFVATSVGALISFLIVIGYEPFTIYEVMAKISYSSLNELETDKMLLFFDTLGVMSGENLLKLLKIFITKKKLSPEITFHELHSLTQKELIITGYNLMKQKTVIFSYKTDPHMSIVLACRITCSVPFIFRPILYQNELYIDGGFIENTPTYFCKTKKHALIIHIHRNNKSTPEIPKDIFIFAQLLFKQMYYNLDKHSMKKCKKYDNIIEIEVTNSSSKIVNFDMKKNEKEYLYNTGYQTASDFFNHSNSSITSSS